MPNRGAFSAMANKVAGAAGHPATFALALSTVAGWAVLGPLFRFSDTWQLVINTGTTIVTFLMVFLIQNTQNRDAKAVQIKLDEIIRALEGAHNVLLDLEELSETDLRKIRARYIEIARAARSDIAKGLKDTAACEIAVGEAVAERMSLEK